MRIFIIWLLFCVNIIKNNSTDYENNGNEDNEDNYDDSDNNAYQLYYEKELQKCDQIMNATISLDSSFSACDKFGANKSDPIYVMERVYCRCDEWCVEYGDCCYDYKLIDKPLSEKKWSCLELYGKAWIKVYGIKQCPTHWSGDERVRRNCEMSDDTGIGHSNYSYLNYVQVLSENTGTMYSNIFCAICNNDFASVRKWTAVLWCQSQNETAINLNHFAYNYNSKILDNWGDVDNSYSDDYCQFYIKEFENFVELQNKYGLRECKTYAGCAANFSGNSWWKTGCDLFLMPVRVTHRTDLLYWDVFKNYYCALCNNLFAENDGYYFSCAFGAGGYGGYGQADGVSYEILLDFGFNTDTVVDKKSGCSDSGELYDPLYQTCLKIFDNKSEKRPKKFGKFIETHDELRTEFTNSSGIQCAENKVPVILNDSAIEYHILPNRDLYLNQSGLLLNESQYEIIIEEDTQLAKVLVCASYSSETDLFFSFPYARALLTKICLSVSIVCLVIHLIFYCLLTKHKSSIFRKIMVSLTVALLMSHIFFLCSAYLEANTTECRIVAMATHYSYLVVFFSMNVMAVDIWLTFRVTRARNQNTSAYLLSKYLIYSWIIPALIVVLSVIFDYMQIHSDYAPHYGRRFCWINNRKALLIFFVIPSGLIFVFNLILFFMTVIKLCVGLKKSKQLSKSSDRIHIYIYAKLALIIGLTWIFGYLAAFTRFDVLWYLFVIFNGSQGFLIFLLYTCKEFMQIKDRVKIIV